MPATRVVSVSGRGRLLTVEFDGQPPLRCERRFLHRVSLAEGQEIEPRLLDRLREAAASDLALARAQRWLAQRPRSRGDIAARLRAEDFDDTAIDAALRKLEAQSALDDGAFAENWVQGRQRRSPRSARLLRQELQGQGVDRAAALTATADLDDDATALELARHQLARKPSAWGVYRQNAGNLLLRRGFGVDVAMRALSAAWHETGHAHPADD